MAVENKPRTSPLSVVALILAILALVLALVFAWGLEVQISEGLQRAQGWGTPTSYGPYSLDIGTSYSYENITTLNPGDRVMFSFSVSGSSVHYWVEDPSYNIILTGYGGDDVMSGSGGFIAASYGTYHLYFTSTGVVTPSVLIINYTVYPI